MLSEYEKQITTIFDKFYKNEISVAEFASNVNRLVGAWDSSRIDIKNQGLVSNTIKFLEYGKTVNLSYPDWYRDETGHGCKLEWNNQDTNFIFSCINSGNLQIILRGVDFRGIDDYRIPIFINFKKMAVNEKTIFEEDVLIWHNEPHIFEKKCEDNEVVYVDLKFKTLFDYFPQLNIRIDENIDFNEIQLLNKKFNQFVLLEKSMLKD